MKKKKECLLSKIDKQYEIDEVWKELNYYGKETTYLISNYGRVKSTQIKGNGYIKYREKILKPLHIGKYLAVCISVDGKIYREYIHRLVAMTFIPVPDNLLELGYTMQTLEVNHILSGDEYKQYNHASNLEWCTSSKNKSHDYNTGIRPYGENSHLSSTNKEYQIRNVCQLLENDKLSIPKISKLTGVDISVIYDVLYGGSWTHVSNDYKLSNYTRKNRKYTDEQINLIKQYIDDGLSIREISNLTNIPYKYIWNIKKKI